MTTPKECGAKKRDGTPCRAPAMANGRCRIHGGKTPHGYALPQTKTGAYSKYLPTRLLERYEDAIADENLLELRGDIALIDARIAELLQRLEQGDLGGLWLKLKDKFAELNIAMQTKDVKATRTALLEMEALINQGAGDYSTWHSLREFTQDKRRLIESERKRLIEGEQMITSEKAMLLVGALVGVIKARVTDKSIISDIQNDIRALLTIGDSG